MNAKRLLQTEHLTPYVKAVRRVYATGFQASVLRQKFPKVDAVIESLMRVIDQQRDEEGPIDFQKLFLKMTFDVIGVVALDMNFGGLDGSTDLLKHLLDVEHAVRQRYRLSSGRIARKVLFLNSTPAREEDRAIDCLTAEYDKLTQQVLNRSDSPDSEESIWYGLKHMMDPETGKQLTCEGLRAEIAMVMVSGTDSTGHQLAWIFSLLAMYPAVVDKLLDELKEHGLHGEAARALTFEDLGDLKYLTTVIKEGMRIAQAISGIIPRLVPDDMIILGYRVPKGTIIVFPSNRLMNSVEDWGDPDVFRPERWLSDEDMSQKHYFGFSYGPRDCAGQRLAMMEMRMTIVRLIKKYKFSPVIPFEELMKNCCMGISVEARDGIYLHVTQREA